MKRVLVSIILVIVLSLIFTVPVMADDPPDTDVDIGIITPGDVTVGIGIDAGGSVVITVNGYNLDQIASQISSIAQALYSLYQAGFITDAYLQNFYSQIIAPQFEQIDDTLTSQNGTITYQGEELNSQGAQLNISLQAIALLILSDNATRQNVMDLATGLDTINQDRQAGDEALQNQINDNGETLNGLTTNQDALTTKQDSMRGDLSIVDSNGRNLSSHVSDLQSTYLILWIVTAVICAGLIGTVITLFIKLSKRT